MVFKNRQLSRRALLRGAALGAAGLTAAFVLGCDDEESVLTPVATRTPLGTETPMAGTTPTAEAKEFPLVSGWYRGSEVKYYDFGMNSATSGSTVATAPIFAFITGMNADGSPQLLEGQHNVVDVVPGEAGYSDLWQVMLVTVPEGYEVDSIKSKGDLDARGFDIKATEMLVNCPIVPAGSTLEGGEPLVQGWNKGDEAFYPDFGQNAAVAIPIFAFITGMNADGSPQFLEGQNNIIDAVPTDAGYSAFWRVTLVTVPDDYEPNSLRSASDVVASGYEMTETDLVVNCPVTVF